LDRRQTAVFRTGLCRWFLRNLLKTADCLCNSKLKACVRPVRDRFTSLRLETAPDLRPLAVCLRFVPFRDTESGGHRQQLKLRQKNNALIGSSRGRRKIYFSFALTFAHLAFTFSPLQPLHQLKTLDDLMAQATHYANFCMRNSGKMAPTLFLIGAEGPLMFVPTSLTDESEKDAFATTARLMCIANAATVCVMAMEAWMKMAKPGEKIDMTEPPSESFDRQEVVVLMGEDRTGQKQKFLPIIRSGNGKFFGFNESDMPQLDSMEGRFAGILPPNLATDEHRTLAKVMLKVKGVNVTKRGTTVRLTPPRR
jgi:hypothetical protein